MKCIKNGNGVFGGIFRNICIFPAKISLYIGPATRRDRPKCDVLNRPKFIELIFIVFLRSASNLRLAKWEAMQVDAKVYFVVHGKLTTTADNDVGEVRMAKLPDRILITVAKCLYVRTIMHCASAR